MNFFRNLKINHQFLIVFGILIIGFAVIGLAYKQVLDVEQTSTLRVQQADKFGGLVNLVSGDVSAMNAEHNEFLLAKDLAHAENFETLVEQVQQKVDGLELTVPDAKALGLISQIREALVAYEDAFDALVDTQVLIGLVETSGLHGEMRAAIQVTEQQLHGLGNDGLVASMLQMRRHEKDFIQRKDSKYLQKMAGEQALFAKRLDKTRIPAKVKNAIASENAAYANAFNAFAKGKQQFETRQEDLNTALYVLQPMLASLLQLKDEVVAANLESVTTERAQITAFFIGAIVASAIVVATVLLLVALRMRRSLSTLHDTVQKVSAGDLSARSRLDSGDELGALGNAFDQLLDERVATLSEVEQERDALNESVIDLLGSVARLSQKDLTVKALVAEDVTGPVSDAVNLMTSETTNVLSQIRAVSEQVEQAANSVKSQADKVTEVAAQERQLVQKSAEELQQAGATMEQLAKEARGANDMADVAMQQTQTALSAVSTTVGGIEQIREIIRETEKRIKRLGERSQEITGAVNLINTIAERTHILALNASMHAASAGEAGRGFAVVADEVQRLAESSREATSDIASMVNAIRLETVDTVDTMNRVIAQVAEGTRLAQEAGKRMGQTEASTAELVAAVQSIAADAKKQVRLALELTKRSQVIVQSSEQTSEELKEQSMHTVRLVDYSNALRDSVGVFKLPAAAA